MAPDRVDTELGSVAFRRVGSGAPLLLLHGGLSDGRCWTPQLESLAEEYDVIAWDAPGCGGSDDPARELDLADYADAVAGLVRGLVGDPVHLVGHSFGAGLAIEVYRRHPRLVRSLVLSGAYAGWKGSLPPDEVAARVSAARRDLRRPPTEWMDLYLDGFFAHDVAPGIRELARRMMLDVRPEGALAMVTAFAGADLRTVLPTIAVPTLLVYGAEDVRAPAPVSEAMSAAIPGSELVVVPGAGHDVNLEAPELFDAAVRAFWETT